jgi:hypothetical protein
MATRHASGQGRLLYASCVKPRGALRGGTDIYASGGKAELPPRLSVSRAIADSSGIVAVEATDGRETQWLLVAVHNGHASFDRLPKLISDPICRLLDERDA